MIYFFIAVVCLLIYAEYKIERRFVNLFSIFGFPYLFLVIVNNFVVYQTGFYKISDAVLLMVLSALVFFFIGMLLAYPKLYTNIGDVEDGKMLSFYNIKAMTIILYLIGTIGLLKVGYLYLTGAFSVVNIDDAEGVMGNGIVGHLLIFSYSILPIVFLYWTYHPKKFYYFIPVLMIVIVAFSSLIKYNVIGVVVTLLLPNRMDTIPLACRLKHSIILVLERFGLYCRILWAIIVYQKMVFFCCKYLLH